jgi:hypothetical protein
MHGSRSYAFETGTVVPSQVCESHTPASHFGRSRSKGSGDVVANTAGAIPGSGLAKETGSALRDGVTLNKRENNESRGSVLRVSWGKNARSNS